MFALAFGMGFGFIFRIFCRVFFTLIFQPFCAVHRECSGRQLSFLPSRQGPVWKSFAFVFVFCALLWPSLFIAECRHIEKKNCVATRSDDIPSGLLIHASRGASQTFPANSQFRHVAGQRLIDCAWGLEAARKRSSKRGPVVLLFFVVIVVVG